MILHALGGDDVNVHCDLATADDDDATGNVIQYTLSWGL